MGYKLTGLRWARSRLLAQALQAGSAELGNHKIVYKNLVATFYYKGTPITEYNFKTLQFKDLPTGFEHTKSTPNQRKVARFAVFEVTGILPLVMSSHTAKEVDAYKESI
jgi:hypothetical protein